MNTTYDVNIVPKTVTKTITRVKIITKYLKIYNRVNFAVQIYESSGGIIDIQYVELADSVYLTWTNDDTLIKNIVLQKTGLIEDTVNPPVYDGNDYIINVIPKNVTYTMNRMSVTFSALKLFTNASFLVELKNSLNNIAYQTQTLTLTNAQYLSWNNDDTYIKQLALQLAGATEAV
jgi:hypothetical protein